MLDSWDSADGEVELGGRNNLGSIQDGERELARWLDDFSTLSPAWRLDFW